MNTHLTKPEPATSPTTAKALIPPLPTAAPAKSRARILYVDDDPQLRSFGELVLVRSGFEVDTAADGALAWEALQNRHYNLLITDNDMPRLTGLELVSNARLAGMRLPIVMASGSHHIMNDEHAWLDLADFIPKPFGIDALLATVDQALARANRQVSSAAVIQSPSARIFAIHCWIHGGINE